MPTAATDQRSGGSFKRIQIQEASSDEDGGADKGAVERSSAVTAQATSARAVPDSDNVSGRTFKKIQIEESSSEDEDQVAAGRPADAPAQLVSETAVSAGFDDMD